MEGISTPFKVSFRWTSTLCFLCNLTLRPITHHRRNSKWHLLCPHTANVTHVVLSSSERRLNRSAPTDGSTSLNGNTQLAPFVLCRLSPSQPPSSYHSLPRLSVTLHRAPLPHYLPTPSVTHTNRHMRRHEWANMLNFVRCSCVSASPSPFFSLPPSACPTHRLLSPHQRCFLSSPLHHADGEAAGVDKTVQSSCRQQLPPGGHSD